MNTYLQPASDSFTGQYLARLCEPYKGPGILYGNNPYAYCDWDNIDYPRLGLTCRLFQKIIVDTKLLFCATLDFIWWLGLTITIVSPYHLGKTHWINLIAILATPILCKRIMSGDRPVANYMRPFYAFSQQAVMSHYLKHHNMQQIVSLRGSPLINQTDAHGRTALLYAAADRKEDVVTQLVSQGADPNIKDNIGATALAYAITGLSKPSTKANDHVASFSHYAEESKEMGEADKEYQGMPVTTPAEITARSQKMIQAIVALPARVINDPKRLKIIKMLFDAGATFSWDELRDLVRIQKAIQAKQLKDLQEACSKPSPCLILFNLWSYRNRLANLVVRPSTDIIIGRVFKNIDYITVTLWAIRKERMQRLKEYLDQAGTPLLPPLINLVIPYAETCLSGPVPEDLKDLPELQG